MAAVALVAGAIALTVGTGGLAGAAIIGAVAVGGIAVGAQCVSDIVSGEVTGIGEYVSKGFGGALTGAATGLIIGAGALMLPSAAEAVGIGTSMLFGGSGATSITLTNLASAGGAATLLYQGLSALSDSIESGSGYNPLKEWFFKGNDEAYDSSKLLSMMTTMGIIQLGAANSRQMAVKSNDSEGTGKLPTEAEMNSSVNEWARMQKSLATSKIQAAKFNTGTIVYDVKTGQYYYGMNRGVQISGDALNPTLKSILPEQSLNMYRLGNCAEVDAVNQALNNGAKINNLYMYTVDVNTGIAKIACENCNYTFSGQVIDILSGILGGK